MKKIFQILTIKVQLSLWIIFTLFCIFILLLIFSSQPNIASAFTAFATIILAFITAYYASSSHKMMKIMERQVVPDIEVEIALPSAGGTINKGVHNLTSLSITVTAFNKNSANGSLTFPTLDLVTKDGETVGLKLNQSGKPIIPVGGGDIAIQDIMYIPKGELTKKILADSDLTATFENNLGEERRVKVDKTKFINGLK